MANKTVTLKNYDGDIVYPRTLLENVKGLPTQILRIDQLVAGLTPVDANAELVDIRVDSEGFTHSCAGDAVRAINRLREVSGINFAHDSAWSQGNVETNGSFTVKNTRISSDYLKVSNLVDGESIVLVGAISPKTYQHRATFFNASKTVISTEASTTWHGGVYEATIPEGAVYVRFSIRISGDSDIAISERVNLYIINNKLTRIKTTKNYVNSFKWINNKYYNAGVLTTSNKVKCTPIIRLWPGAIINISSMYKVVSGIYGTRLSLWNNGAYVKDIEPGDMYGKAYIKIPDNCNEISFVLFNTDEEPYINIYPDLYTVNDVIVSTLLTIGVDPLCGKRVSILGDSVSTFGGNATDDPENRISDGTWTYAGNRCRYPQNNLFTDVDSTWWKRLINKHNMILGINESWAGSCVSFDGTESADRGATKHIASLTRIGHLGENGTPDLILVYGGANDVGLNIPVGTFNTENPREYDEDTINSLPVATFADAYRALLIRLQYYYKTSRIVCILPYHTKTYYPSDRLDSYCEVIKEACDYFGIDYIDARADGVTMFNVSSYMPDSAHYNADGAELLSNAIDNKLTKIFG